MSTPEIYYRAFVDLKRCDYASYDEEDWEICFFEYWVIKRTQCGTWVQRYFDGYMVERKRFILDNAVKKYAHPTKEEALAAFVKRKERHLAHLEHHQSVARIGLHLAKKQLGVQR